MNTTLPWHLVPSGSRVLGKDGYEWTVTSVGPADPGAPSGSVKVTMARDDRGEVTGHPPAGQPVTVMWSPPPPSAREAVAVLRERLGAEIVSCAWCHEHDVTAECACDVNCGQSGCVNF